MQHFQEWLANAFDPHALGAAIRVAVWVLVGLPVLYAFSRIVGKLARKRLGEHAGILTRKAIFFVGFVIVATSVLFELGFKLAGLLGAAGILSVAIGFASQTSLSNLISGLFLYWEKPFAVGDVIKVGDTTGFVLSIDLLSVKLRQFDNQFVRIPNETMIKAQVTTMTKFPIRRLDIAVGVHYREDMDRVVKALKKAADQNPFCLDEPAPIVIWQGFGDSSINYTLAAWCDRTQFLDLRNSLSRDVKKIFDAEGIEIPFPQRVVTYAQPPAAPPETNADVGPA